MPLTGASYDKKVTLLKENPAAYPSNEYCSCLTKLSNWMVFLSFSVMQCNILCNIQFSYHNHNDATPPEMIRVQFYLYSRPVWCHTRPIKSHLVKKVDFFTTAYIKGKTTFICDLVCCCNFSPANINPPTSAELYLYIMASFQTEADSLLS